MSTVHFVVDPQPQDKIHTSSNGRLRPRPILKSLPITELSPLPFSTYPLDSPHVHFPPTPTLTSTTFTHSAIVYDRAPTVVADNICALPERGGRCYTPQPRGQRSSSRRASGHYQTGMGVGGLSIGPRESCGLATPDPKGSYFHPRAFEVCEPEQSCGLDRHPQYASYFLPDSPSDSSSSSESSSSSSPSSEFDSDSDSSYGSFSPSSTIFRVAMDTLTLGGTPYLNSPLIEPSQNVPSQHYSHPSTIPQPQQQLSYLVHYPCSPGPDLAESKPKTAATRSGSNRKVKGSSTSQFGGGFSDQSMVLEGCLGGF
jgi:hypothetical protein